MHMPMEFSDSDDNAAPVEDDEHDRGRVKKVAARSEEEAELDPAQVREDLLDFLDDLSSAEETTGSDSDDDQHRKYHHLPWRGRCWRGDFISIPRRASRRAMEDTWQYRHNYPDIDTGNPFLYQNHEFYANKKRARPCGELIDDIHLRWWGKYRKLETEENYIEWLFPIRETSTNWHSQDLQKREMKSIIEEWELHNRVLTSYEMMLDFYGMRLKDHRLGTVGRSPGWRERFKCLNQSSSCHRHISRILKCLGELNHENLKAPFVEFILHEAITEGTLPNTLDSCMEYWVDLIRSGRDRGRLKRKARQLSREHNWKVLEERAATVAESETN